jgi:hypothetical protein
MSYMLYDTVTCHNNDGRDSLLPNCVNVLDLNQASHVDPDRYLQGTYHFTGLESGTRA